MLQNGRSSNGNGRGRGRGGHHRGRGGHIHRANKGYSHQFQQNNHEQDPALHANGRDDYVEFPGDYATLSPVFAAPSEFIMPYVAGGYYPPPFPAPLTPIADGSTLPPFVPVDSTVLMDLVRKQM